MVPHLEPILVVDGRITISITITITIPAFKNLYQKLEKTQALQKARFSYMHAY